MTHPVSNISIDPGFTSLFELCSHQLTEWVGSIAELRFAARQLAKGGIPYCYKRENGLYALFRPPVGDKHG